MKTKHFLVLVVTLFASHIQIANSQTYWRWGGDVINNSNTDYIGTFNVKNFDIRTSNKFRMRVDSSTGYVLISNTAISPANLLHLYNSDSVTAVIGQISNGNSTFPNGLRFGINSSNEGIINMYDAKPLNFLTANTQRMTILGAPVSGYGFAGNVGIGTEVPVEKLQVNGNILANGKMLVADSDAVYDLLAMILQLQNEVAELKEQIMIMTKN